MHHPAFRDGPHREGAKAFRTLQPFQERLLEEALTRVGSDGTKGGQLFLAEPGVFHPIDQRTQAGGNAVARLMYSVVGVGTEVIVELGLAVGETITMVKLGHGQLVMICGEDALVEHGYHVT